MQSIELKNLLRQSDFIANELQIIRNDIEKDRNKNHNPELPASQYIERAINLRLAFRNLADGIEANRNLVQIQKQKIEKSKVLLQGLHYFKTDLTQKIKKCSINVTDINEYVDVPLQIEDWVDRFDEKEEMLMNELENKKKKQAFYENLVKQKARKQAEIREKKEVYQKILPTQAKKILQQIQETSKFFYIENYQNYDNIKNKDLSTIYDRLNSLRSRKLVNVIYNNDQFQQLEIIISKNQHRYYKQAVLNKINVTDSQIKLTIASLAPHYNKLVIGLDRRQDFSNEEVFNRLVNNEAISSIFTDPQNQLERNMNAKYVKFEWINTLLLSGIISPEGLFDLIIQRIFCLKMMSFIIKNIAKLTFFFPLYTQNQVPALNNLKKVVSGNLQKITFSVYSQLTHQPDYLKRYIKCLDKQGRESGKSEANKSRLHNFLKLIKMQELVSADSSNYYKGAFTIHQNVVQFVLIMPWSYPKQRSTIRIINTYRKKEEDKKGANLDTPCKFQASVEVKIIPERILNIEKAVNEQMVSFFKGDESNNPFRILLQINRLITLLSENEKKN